MVEWHGHRPRRVWTTGRRASLPRERTLQLTRVPWRRSIGVALLLLALFAAACTTDPQTTIDPKSDVADSVHSLYILIFILSAIVLVGVLGAVIVFSFMFRERPGREARQFHGNTRVEVLWTVIPVIIVVIITVPTFFVIFDTADPPDGALEIEVTAHQWWFEFDYPEYGITTANEIHLPVDRAASFALRSDDVIHSFWIPQLVGKVDVVPGHENELWFTPNEPGLYLGQCAEFCGLSHANMRFRVFVDTQQDFDAWVANERADRVEPATQALAAGEQLFLGNACIGCHTIKGTAAAGLIGPNLTHLGGRSTIAAGIMDNTQDNLVRWISDPDREKPGIDPKNDSRFMPAFEEILTQEQIASIAQYLRSLQ